MSNGVVLENRKILSYHRQGLWVEEKGAFTGKKIVDLKGRKHLPVETYRCPKCGFLQSYAS